MVRWWRPAAPLHRRGLPACHGGSHAIHPLSTFTPALTVVTTRELKISTGWRSGGDIPGCIPLAVNDVYALHEQLPYAYFFREALTEASLAASLEQVLAAFPVLGGRLCLDSRAIQLSEDDVVPLAIGRTQVPLDEWMQAGHAVDPKTGRPQLLELFDPLPQNPWDSRTPLARVRVTHMADGGTCIGVNISHAAADAASCIHFVYCWGRQHSGLPYQVPTNNRAEVTVSGMLTAESADLMNLYTVHDHTSASVISQVFGFSAKVLGLEPKPEPKPVTAHGYLLLPFSLEVLRAMKAYGTRECARVLAAGVDSQDEAIVRFVSTNDMVTSAGWMIMRQLSGNEDSAMNIIVNIRGRGGTTDIGAEHGVFGNGITAATATVAAQPAASTIDLQSVARGARAARRALLSCYESLPDRLAASRRGAPQLPSAIGAAFSTTTWHFPLWELNFAEQHGVGNRTLPACSDELNPSAIGATALWTEAIKASDPSSHTEHECAHGKPIAFHGQPVHPLPPGETYAGVVVPSAGMDYQLFLPVSKMAEARRSHELLCKAFLSTVDSCDAA